MNNKRILIVDDSEALLKMTETLMKKEGFTNVKTASCGKDAIKIAEEWKPELVVLDIMMPDMDGFEVCSTIRRNSIAHILFLSAKNAETDRIKAFGMGGDDYLSKPFNNKELIMRIKAKLARDMYYEKNNSNNKQENVVRFGEFCLDLNRKALYKEKVQVELSLKEYLLLEYLITNKNITLSKELIVQNVWGDSYDGYDNTISVHIRHLREKVENVSSKPMYIKTVKGIGYRFELDEKRENYE